MKIRIYILILFFTSSNFFLANQNSKIGLLLPNELQNNDKIVDQSVIDDITRWELFLMQNNLNYTVLFPDDIDLNILSNLSVLIIPTSGTLSVTEAELIDFAINEGLGLMITGKITIKNENQEFDFCEYVYKIQKFSFDFENSSIIQSFSNQKNIFPFEEFNLLIRNDNEFYRVTGLNIKSFGEVNVGKNLTKSFYGFKGKGRFVHFAFTINHIISGKIETNLFEKNLIHFLNWLKKDSGIWLSSDEDFNRQFFVLINEKSGLTVQPGIIRYLKTNNIPVLIETNGNHSRYADQLDNCNYVISIDSEQFNIDSLLNSISESEVDEKFVLLNKSALNNSDLRKLSFRGIKNVFINSSGATFYDDLSDLLVLPVGNNELTGDKITRVRYLKLPLVINCDSDFLNECTEKIELLKENFEALNREKLINDFLISSISVKSVANKNSFKIFLINNHNREIKNLKLFIDSQLLSDAIIYEISIDGEVITIQKEEETNYSFIELPYIKPKSETVIQVLFEKNS